MENQAVIDRVCIHFVFAGDPAEAERSQALDKLREDLENKKYLIDQFFGREVTLIIEFRSAKTKKAGAFTHVTKTHSYPLELTDTISMLGPDNELLTVGFVRIMELYAMFKEMGSRFFDRNIRGALPEDEVVNRSLTRAFRRIVLEGKDLPSVFPFNHNGVALSAEVLEEDDGRHENRRAEDPERCPDAHHVGAVPDARVLTTTLSGRVPGNSRGSRSSARWSRRPSPSSSRR